MLRDGGHWQLQAGPGCVLRSAVRLHTRDTSSSEQYHPSCQAKVEKMTSGVCKLCRLEKNLQSSHFLPAALYKSLLNPEETNPSPYLMSATKTVESSRQIKDYVLCADCERRLNENGERWVLAHMAREGKFPLREMLRKATPIRSIPGLTTYAAGMIAEIDVDKLEYFALSVFWRAAVHDWKPLFGDQYERLELGPYRELLREFLFGVAPFPSNVITTVSVYEEEEFVRSMFPPSAGTPRREEGRPYSFLIPGIQFTMALGNRLSAGTRDLSSHLKPERRIFMSPLVNLRVKSVYDKLRRKQLHSQSIGKESSRE
jgi:hypothetical protein